MPLVPRPGLGQAEGNGFHPDPAPVVEEAQEPALCVPCMVGRVVVLLILTGLTAYLIYRVRQEQGSGKVRPE